MFKRIRKAKGFTLIEMLIVLFIIGLLLLLILPNLNVQKNKVQDKTDQALVNTVQTQVELYLDDDDSQEVTLEELETKGFLSKNQVKQANNRHIKINNNHVEQGK